MLEGAAEPAGQNVDGDRHFSDGVPVPLGQKYPAHAPAITPARGSTKRARTSTIAVKAAHVKHGPAGHVSAHGADRPKSSLYVPPAQ